MAFAAAEVCGINQFRTCPIATSAAHPAQRKTVHAVLRITKYELRQEAGRQYNNMAALSIGQHCLGSQTIQANLCEGMVACSRTCSRGAELGDSSASGGWWDIIIIIIISQCSDPSSSVQLNLELGHSGSVFTCRRCVHSAICTSHTYVHNTCLTRARRVSGIFSNVSFHTAS